MRWGRLLVYALGSACLATAVWFVVGNEDTAVPRVEPVETQAGVTKTACPSGTGGRVTCANVKVPEDYSDPEIKVIELFTARILPPAETTALPIAFIGAEIGEAGVENLTEWQKLSRVFGREVILIDLRGVGASVPRLGCIDAFRNEWLQAELGPEGLAEALAANEADVNECRRRLQREVPLEAYSLDAMATDLEMVRRELGVEEWTLVAGGAATSVARRTDALFPDSTASLVLLGAAPSSPEPQLARYRYAVEVLDDSLGAEARADLDEIVERLARQPIEFAVQVKGRTERVLVSDEMIAATIARTLDDADFRQDVDAFVSVRLAGGEHRALALLRGTQRRELIARNTSVALAVTCAETEAPVEGSAWFDAEDFDARWTSLLDDPTLDPGACRAWDVIEPIGAIGEPTSPTLVLNGRFDIGAPPSAAAEISETWSQATVLVLDNAARPLPFDECVATALTEFLAGREPTLGSSC